MPAHRDNVKAGLFVILGVAAVLVVVFTLTDFNRFFQETQQVRVYYPLSIGLQGLKEGSDVTIGNSTIGKVVAIENWPEEGRVQGHVIVFEVPESEQYKFGWDARFELSTQLIGSEASLNIRSVGDGEPYDPSGTIPHDALMRPHVPKGTDPAQMPWHKDLFGQRDPNNPPTDVRIVEVPPNAIPGAIPVNNLFRSLGVEDEQRNQIQNIIADVETLAATLRADIPEVTTRVKTLLEDAKPVIAKADETMTNIRDASVDAKATVADLRGRSKGWFDQVDTIGTKANTLLDTGQAAMASGQRSLEKVETVLKDKEPQIRQAIDDVAAITKRAREETMEQVASALKKADTALGNLESASAEIKTFAVGQRPVLERAMANLQITAAQLKLASIEVRRSPWRLIYQPTDEELEYDNLYDAARSFALAAEALSAASESLRAVSINNTASPQQVNKMVDHLEELFGKFKETEGRFWQELNGKGAPAGNSP